MKARVSTDLVTSRDKIALWVDIVCAHLVQVDCRRVEDPISFTGSVSKLALPQLEIAQIRAGGQTVCRTARQISQAQDEFLLVNIQRTGKGLVRQNGREAILQPGDFTVYSSTRPYELAFQQDFAQTVLIFPAQALPHMNEGIDRISALTVSGNREVSQLLVRLADAAYDKAEGLPGVLLPTLTETLLQTLAAATSEIRPDGKKPQDLARYHTVRVKAFAMNHLRDPELSVARIANGARISMSHLHRLFAIEPKSIMEWVWEQRLIACEHDLADAGKSHLSVSEIAFGYGYNDASHFSRAFRARFGMSPREWRFLNAAPEPVSPSAQPG